MVAVIVFLIAAGHDAVIVGYQEAAITVVRIGRQVMAIEDAGGAENGVALYAAESASTARRNES